MLNNHFTEKLIGLQDVLVQNIEENNNNVYIYIEMKKKVCKCPCCNNDTIYIHDYRKQTIKDISAFGKNVFLILRKRRYVCKQCRKRFYEKNNWLPHFYRMTNRLAAYIIEKLSDTVSFTHVAKEVNLSVSTVIRVFDNVNYSKPQLPNILAIDEFKGNTGGEKYNCIVTNPFTGQVLDILPKRHFDYLIDYFKHTNRSEVKYFIFDMWRPYRELASCYFRSATQIVDKYHYVRQVIWALEYVRKDVQQKFGRKYRIYFKKSRQLLIKRFKYLSNEEKQQVQIMTSLSADLQTAHFLKEHFFELLDIENYEEAKKHLNDWILNAQDTRLKRFNDCANTFVNWFDEILNSIKYNYSNGFTEGCNNKIKVIKRNAFGYRNFNRFRNRILHSFNKSINKENLEVA